MIVSSDLVIYTSSKEVIPSKTTDFYCGDGNCLSTDWVIVDEIVCCFQCNHRLSKSIYWALTPYKTIPNSKKLII